MNKYNDKYNNVVHDKKVWRLYNEFTTDSYTALYSETQIKLIELIEKYNYKIYYFYCEPATNLKLEINNYMINLEADNVEEIKKNQLNDFYYLYKNQICEVFYSFFKTNNINIYYFDFMLVVNKNFSLNEVLKHNFRTIKIYSVEQIDKKKITFDFIQSIFEKRVVTLNNYGLIHDKNSYDISKLEYGYINYVNNFKNGLDDLDLQEYNNFNSFYFRKNFDNDRYVKDHFKLLCSHIWSLGRFFYKEKNNFGLMLMHKDLYNMDSLFLTNYAKIIGLSSININFNKIKINKEFYTYSSLSDNLYDQGINMMNFNKEYINSNKIDLDSLQVFDQNFIYE